MSKIELYEADMEALKSLLEGLESLESSPELVTILMPIFEAKKKAQDVLEEIEKLEDEAKNIINGKAKALYGPSWEVIKGDGYKITRSKTGSVYESMIPTEGGPVDIIKHLSGEYKEILPFIALKVSVDSKAVTQYREENDALPTGISINDQRGESIRFSFK